MIGNPKQTTTSHSDGLTGVCLRWTPLHPQTSPLSHPYRRTRGAVVAAGEPAKSSETDDNRLFPDGEQLAIGTDAGHIAIINPLTGDRIWKTRISEGYAKHAAFSPDGKGFYIGEQSPDGFIYAYDLSTTKPTLLWKYRMADDIDTSTPQNPDDVYAWVQYPGPYRISTTEGNDLLVAGNHSWTKDGVGLKKAQLYRFDGETGTLKWKWPPNQTLPMTISWFDYSRDAKMVATARLRQRRQ